MVGLGSGVRHPARLPRLEEWEILIRADSYHAQTTNWPMEKSGPLPEAPGESWSVADAVLRAGTRG